jgi:hypothetical protein
MLTTTTAPCISVIYDICSCRITTKVVSSNPVHGEVYSMQNYVTKFVSDLRQVGGFLRVLTTTI